MTDLFEVEVDGEVDLADDGGAPAWGLPAAIAVVGVLCFVVLLKVVIPGQVGHHRGLLAGREAGTKPARPQNGSVLHPPGDPRLSAVRDALAAWGRFGGSGDVAVLDGSFAPDGPQYRLLAEDSGHDPAVRGGQPYTVELTDEKILTDDADEVIVAGTVTWTRVGEPDQVVPWQIVMHRAGGRLLLWTVRS